MRIFCVHLAGVESFHVWVKGSGNPKVNHEQGIPNRRLHELAILFVQCPKKNPSKELILIYAGCLTTSKVA